MGSQQDKITSKDPGSREIHEKMGSISSKLFARCIKTSDT